MLIIEIFFQLMIYAIVGLAIFGSLYVYRLNNTDIKSFWARLAKTNRLDFESGVFSGATRITGHYQRHKIELLTTLETRQPFILIKMFSAASNRQQTEKYIQSSLSQPEKDSSVLLSPANDLPVALNGQFDITPEGQALHFSEQYYLTKGQAYLESVFDMMSGLLDDYPKVVALGGEAIPSLYSLAKKHRHPLKPVAIELLHSISRETTHRLNGRADHLYCSSCLHKCAQIQPQLSLPQSIKYYGCRRCGQSRSFIDGHLIAVLDNQQTETEVTRSGGVLCANWSVHRELFDFEQVHIFHATDEDVERFAVQVGNDTDSFRKPRYATMTCVISPKCHLLENTMRILARMFGSVEQKVKVEDGRIPSIPVQVYDFS